MRVKAVLLDVGNVLWDDDPVDAMTFYHMRNMFKGHGLEVTDHEVADIVDEAVRASAPSVNDFLLEALAAKAGVEVEEARAEWAVLFAPEQMTLVGRRVLFDDVGPSLQRLKAAGLRLAVATNYGESVRARLHGLGVGALIDVWGLAPEVGALKPAPAFFDWILNRLECHPGEAVMVGDRQDNDIAPAKRLGLHAVRITHGLHKEQKPKARDEAPDYSAGSFADAAQWILARASPTGPGRR